MEDAGDQRTPDSERLLVAPGGRNSRIAGVAISVIALAGCLIWALDQPAPSFPTSAPALAELFATLPVLAFAFAVRGFRLHVVLDRAGIAVARAEPYALIVAGFFGNTVLPLRGGEALRVYLLKQRSDSSWANAIGAVVPERVLELFTLTILLGGLVVAGVVAVPGSGLVAGIGALAFALAAAGLAVFRRLRRRGMFARLADRVRPFAHASRLLLTPAGAALALLTFGIWACDASIYFLVGDALELGIEPLEALGIATVAAAFSAIPAGPGYAGTLDAAVLAALAALDVPSGASISFVLLMRFVVFVPIVVAGLAVMVTRYGGFAALRSTVPS